jgi:hypothetical protein
MRIIANEKKSAPAPTKNPDNPPRIEAPRLTIHHNSSNGSAPNIQVLRAHGRPARTKSPRGLAVFMGSAAATKAAPTSTKTVASIPSVARRALPGIADRNANVAEITAAAAKKSISIA